MDPVVTPQPARKSRKVLWIVLGSVSGVMLLTCFCCIGVVLFGLGAIEDEVRPQLAGDATLQEQIGELESFKMDFMTSMDQPGENTLVFNVKGALGEGVIFAECVTQDDGSELVVSAKLKLPDGREYDLLQDAEE